MHVRPFFAALATAALGTALAAAPGVAAPATTHKPTEFGAKLTKNIQPSNSAQAHSCKETTGHKGSCTRILMEAYGRPDGGEKAPRDGTLKQIKLIAGTHGSGIIEIARVKPDSIKNNTGRAELVQKGPTIHYNGQADPNAETFTVETFPVNLPVKKGDYLAWQSTATSTERCESGGASQLVYQPKLTKADGFKKAPFHDGCFLLLEGVY
jgi:hypothetical protein